MPDELIMVSLSTSYFLTNDVQMNPYKLSHQLPKIHLDVAVVQLFYQEVKLSIPTVMRPKPLLLLLGKHDEDNIFITGG